MEKMEKLFIEKFFQNLSTETFEIDFWDETSKKFGEGDNSFRIKFNKPLNKKAVLQDASLAFGEAYMDGNIEFDGDLQMIIESIYKNKESFLHKHKFLSKVLSLKGTPIRKQKQDISYHYDIGNDFYKLWLDESMSYSCAYFKNKDDSLKEAQSNKIDHILKKLHLEKGQSLLDIGCGWGTLIIRAAREYKVHATGITLSEEQYEEVKRKIKQENLEELVEVKLMDYRDLPKEKMMFDRVVSVGMLEHVGHANISIYAETVNKVLKDKGVALIHSITGLHDSTGNEWIKKYIFPGGHIPSVSQIISTFSLHDFHLVDAESLRLHYSKTLEHWSDNFEANLDKIKEKFDEKFIRMWRLYLKSCAASFKHGVVNIHQFMITKNLNNEIPTTRDYLYR